jgi:protein-glutamine gamma-glutamyltransferase
VSTVAPRPGLGEPQVRRGRPVYGPPRLAPDPTVPAAIGRGVAFALLALFGGLHWMALLEPGEPGRAFTGLLVAGAAAVGVLAAGRLSGRVRLLALAVVTVAALALAMLAGSIPAELLRPARWGELADGINRGVAALPGVRVPYRGVEPWIRTVMPLGGTVLMTVAALLAFWPRRERLGYPFAALLALVVLYVVPAVALDFTVEFLRGALLAVLVVAFLRVDKLRVRDAKLAAACAAGVALAGLVVAPALDSGTPWWDYENWALEASSAKSTSYSWDHTYGPLDWPRDGREVLRVKARRPAYWKAENLDEFDGTVWRHVDINRDALDSGTPDNLASIRTWTQTIKVSVRNLKSVPVITGGYTSDVSAPTLDVRPRDDGTYVADQPLKRGDSYTAQIYSPQPNERQRRAVRVSDGIPLDPYLRLSMPVQGRIGDPNSDLVTVQFPRWGTKNQQPVAAFEDKPIAGNFEIARTTLDQGPYAGVWRLAQQLKRGTRTEEDYVQAILRYLGDGFGYSELPPKASYTLPGFLLDSKIGYCQQFSGAMALMLRMSGIPARVATGFTRGSYNTDTGEYRVRDLDAHSWVEVWYPDYGWITFDPTPASAPPRAQPDEAGAGTANPHAAQAPNFGGDVPSQRSGPLAATEDGVAWWEIGLAAIALAGLGVFGVRRWRRRGRPQPALDELERALRRTRRDPGPATTLRSLESLFAGTPAAADYVRAVRDARYGGRTGTGPTRSQRRGLRIELGRGGGVLGRLRAWWALPPHR